MNPNASALAVATGAWGLAWATWWLGHALWFSSPGPRDAVALGALLAATAVLLALDALGRGGPWRPLAFAATITSLVVMDPPLDTATGRLVVLVGGALLVFGYHVLGLRARVRAARMAGCAVDATALGRFAHPRIGLVVAMAAAAAFALLGIPMWTAAWVSARWAVSLDAVSLGAFVAVASAGVLVAGGVTLLRFGWAAAEGSPSGAPAEAAETATTPPRHVRADGLIAHRNQDQIRERV